VDATIRLLGYAPDLDGEPSWRTMGKIAAWELGLSHDEADDLTRRMAVYGPLGDFELPLSDDDDDDDERSTELGRPLHIVCANCWQSLGDYTVGRSGDMIVLVPKGRLGNWRRGRVRMVDREEGESLHYEWKCGCGAEGYRRADRIGAIRITLDFDEGWMVAV
jgi:hypothetical protein